MKSVLIIRLSSIGDIFHTFTLLPDIKQALPEARIDWLVDESFRGVAELSPLIDNVISIPLRQWKKNKISWLFNLFKFKRKLAKNQCYDYIIDTQGLIKSAVLSKLLFKGPIYGLDRKSAREGLASFFYDHSYQIEQNNVAVLRLRGLVAKIFNLKHNLKEINFKVNSSDCGYSFGYGFILFLHGTSKENKKWPLANWLEFSQWLLQHSTKEIVVTYSNESEYEFTQQLAAGLNSTRLRVIEKLSFLRLCDLVKQADIIIGVDTGFTHLANLLTKPSLAIYLHSDPAYVGMLENSHAHNFGGYKLQVAPYLLSNYLQQHNLL